MHLNLKDKYIIYAIELLIVIFLFTGNNYNSSDILSFGGSILGSLLGVLGAYYIFNIQVINDKNNKRDIILELLNYTLTQTEYLVFGYVDEMALFIKKEGLKENWSEEDIKKIIESYVIGTVWYNVIEEDLEDKKIQIYHKQLEFKKKRYIEDYKELKDLYKLIYYKNWQESIIYLDEKYREEIIGWILYLEQTKEVFEDIPSKYISIESTSNRRIRQSRDFNSLSYNEVDNKKTRIGYEINDFIENREYIVEIMNKIYKENKRYPTIVDFVRDCLLYI